MTGGGMKADHVKINSINFWDKLNFYIHIKSERQELTVHVEATKEEAAKIRELVEPIARRILGELDVDYDGTIEITR